MRGSNLNFITFLTKRSFFNTVRGLLSFYFARGKTLKRYLSRRKILNGLHNTKRKEKKKERKEKEKKNRRKEEDGYTEMVLKEKRER